MIVISDTGPINYLVLIGQAEILPSLYRRVSIPQVVFDELGDPDTPEPVTRLAPQHRQKLTIFDYATGAFGVRELAPALLPGSLLPERAPASWRLKSGTKVPHSKGASRQRHFPSKVSQNAQSLRS